MHFDSLPTAATTPSADWNQWRWQLRNSAVSVDTLLRAGSQDGAMTHRIHQLLRRYPFRVTPYYASLVRDIDTADPIGRQFLPSLRELDGSDSCFTDPFNEWKQMPAPRLIRRYRNRAVLLATNQCAVYCRHCTRKNTLNSVSPPRNMDDFRLPLEYIRTHDQIREVIVSGGDPLLLDAALLDNLLGELQDRSHVEVVRIGTRVPVTLPMRITPSLCQMLASHRPLWINTQFNHPAELTEASIAACDMLLRCGIPVSNQSVLLKGVNDDIATMAILCNRLQRHMIRPYYVFQCDPVAGTAHFATDPPRGMEIEEALRNELGGLSLPRFVADVPGSKGKTPLTHLNAIKRSKPA